MNEHKATEIAYKNGYKQGLLDSGNLLEFEEQQSIKEVTQQMITKFGEGSQIDVAIEEMSELIKELVKYKRSKIHDREKQTSSREHVIEEIGDVLFMMEYLKEIFQISNQEIHSQIIAKANRTAMRYLYGKDD